MIKFLHLLFRIIHICPFILTIRLVLVVMNFIENLFSGTNRETSFRYDINIYIEEGVCLGQEGSKMIELSYDEGYETITDYFLLRNKKRWTYRLDNGTLYSYSQIEE